MCKKIGLRGTCYTCRKREFVLDGEYIDRQCSRANVEYIGMQAATTRNSVHPPCHGDEWERDPAVELKSEKPCTACGRSLPLGAFYRDKHSPDGRQDVCAMCRREEK